MTFASVIIMLMVPPAQTAVARDMRLPGYPGASARIGMLAVTPPRSGAAHRRSAIVLHRAESAINTACRNVTPVTGKNMKMNGEDKA